MVALNERLSDTYKLLPPVSHPGLGERRRRSLREVVADRRAAHTNRDPDAPASGLAGWLTDRHRQAEPALAAVMGHRIDHRACVHRAGHYGSVRCASRTAARCPLSERLVSTRGHCRSLRMFTALQVSTASASQLSVRPWLCARDQQRQTAALGDHDVNAARDRDAGQLRRRDLRFLLGLAVLAGLTLLLDGTLLDAHSP